MPALDLFSASSERLRALADRLDAAGDADLAAAARHAAAQVDADRLVPEPDGA